MYYDATRRTLASTQEGFGVYDSPPATRTDPAGAPGHRSTEGLNALTIRYVSSVLYACPCLT